MRVQTKTGKFASKDSAIYRFCQRTGGTPADYYKWATECGQRASNNGKDKLLLSKFGLQDMQDFVDLEPLNCNGVSPNEIYDYILERCDNPVELAACYLELRQNWKDYQDKNDFIEANLSAFPKASFLRWSDKNLIAQVSPSWLKSNGIALDVQAENLTECFYLEISIDDIVDHVLNHRKGKYVNPKHTIMALYRERLESLCGFNLTEKYIEHLADFLLKTEDSQNIEVMDLDDLPF